ncbi:DUF3298 and DUF4163 domain-containing protein [Kushneria aurantia]|uniref:DUF3298 domain-containing protein n=1 Tax=Kushneria aurantia TaxID=504092 RepID=A0ABV6FZQ5_9GAMM|nr:DUF3298 and DUF4163 domain-containing protein [Kushneria aurantia]
MHVLARHTLIAAALLLVLGGCVHGNTEGASVPDSAGSAAVTPQALSAPLTITPHSRTLTAPDCEGVDEACGRIEADWLTFDNSTALSEALMQRLLRMAAPMSDAPSEESATPATLDAFAADFFNQSLQANAGNTSPRPWQADLEAQQIARHDDLVVLALNSWVYTGGAHGMPITNFMVIDERRREVVTLDDMLLPGAREAFDSALHQAWQRWLADSEAGQTLNPKDWPFVTSDNVAPLKDQLAVRYDVYSLGPYVIGQPQLTIPYDALAGVLKPRFLPGGATH